MPLASTQGPFRPGIAVMLAALLAPLLLASESVSLARSDLASASEKMFLTGHAEHAFATDALAAASASYPKFFAAAGKRPVRFVCAADVDGDGNDELIVVRERVAKNKLTLHVLPAPNALGSKLPKAAAAYTA